MMYYALVSIKNVCLKGSVISLLFMDKCKKPS